MNALQKSNWRVGVWLGLVLAAGLAARFWLGTFGHTFDFETWCLVAGIVEQGKDVYASTTWYNFGPGWWNILHVLDLLARHDPAVFRWLLIGCLSAVDVGIFCVLWRKFGRLAATLFFLNPVSIMVDGYHNQFDNIAVLLGLWAVLLLGDQFDRPVGRRKLLGLAVLGLSLMTKHLLFAFPFWLAVKQKGLWQKCLVLAVPVVTFLLGFAPYWAADRAEIIHNVFLYKSFNIGHFYTFFMPTAVQSVLNAETVWFFALGVFAFINRRRPALESLLLYTCVLVATAPATSDHYLATPSAFTSVFVNFFTVAYTVIAAYQVSGDVPGLLPPRIGTADALAIYALCLALVWVTWRDNLLDLLSRCHREIKVQLGQEE
ncbi:MAG TPA: hypothetical protein VMB80_09275 [Candidatus Acidoferrum sp.]|nr:hypothetical protein [Candidatus Acidoferrum sp.]